MESKDKSVVSALSRVPTKATSWEDRALPCSTAEAAPTSMGSPRGVPVPCISSVPITCQAHFVSAITHCPSHTLLTQTLVGHQLLHCKKQLKCT